MVCLPQRLFVVFQNLHTLGHYWSTWTSTNLVTHVLTARKKEFPDLQVLSAPFHLFFTTVASASIALMRYEPGLLALVFWFWVRGWFVLLVLGLFFCLVLCSGAWLVSP